MTEKKNENMMIIFKKEDQTYKNQVFDDYKHTSIFFQYLYMKLQIQ